MKTLMINIILLLAFSSQAFAMSVYEVIGENGEVTHIINEPTYPGTGFRLRFDEWKKENGVCQLLGYDRAVPQSSVFGSGYERVLMIDQYGSIENLRSDINRLKQIICIDKLNPSRVTPKKLVQMDEPRHADSQTPLRFDEWKKEDGLCLYLGHAKAVPYSTVFASGYERVIMLDSQGKIEKLRSDINRVTSIICVAH